VKEAAHLLSVSVDSVRRWIRRGLLKALRLTVHRKLLATQRGPAVMDGPSLVSQTSGSESISNYGVQPPE
jgi:excisionase family DNA binding protein